MNKLEKILADYEKEGLLFRGGINEQELITFTFHSTSIEGSSLTYDEVYALLNDNIAANKSLEHNQMNIDHADAYRYALNRFKEDKGLDMNFIQSINARVMKNTGKLYNTVLGSWDESKGEIRVGSVHVTGRYFPDYKKVPELTGQMCNKFNERMECRGAINGVSTFLKTKEDILNLSFDLQYNLVSIHPFSDGNGRTARILTNAILYAYDMPRMILQAEKKSEYYRALEATRKKNEIVLFRDFMYKNYLAQIQEEIKANKQAKGGKGMFMAF